MSTLSKRDAMKLVADIRDAKLAAHALAERTGGGDRSAMAGFLGALESVLHYHLTSHGCFEAAQELSAAMNDTPTASEIAAQFGVHPETISRIARGVWRKEVSL